MQEETPPVEPVLDGNDVVQAIVEGFARALVDWWYVWLLMLALIVAAAWLNAWSRRLEARRRSERRARDRAKRAAEHGLDRRRSH